MFLKIAKQVTILFYIAWWQEFGHIYKKNGKFVKIVPC